MAAFDCLSEGNREKGDGVAERPVRCLISGVLSHTGMRWRDWCCATEEREEKTKREFGEAKPQWSPSSFKVSFTEHMRRYSHNAQSQVISLSLCFPSLRGSVFDLECNL